LTALTGSNRVNRGGRWNNNWPDNANNNIGFRPVSNCYCQKNIVCTGTCRTNSIYLLSSVEKPKGAEILLCHCEERVRNSQKPDFFGNPCNCHDRLVTTKYENLFLSSPFTLHPSRLYNYFKYVIQVKLSVPYIFHSIIFQ